MDEVDLTVAVKGHTGRRTVSPIRTIPGVTPSPTRASPGSFTAVHTSTCLQELLVSRSDGHLSTAMRGTRAAAGSELGPDDPSGSTWVRRPARPARGAGRAW